MSFPEQQLASAQYASAQRASTGATPPRSPRRFDSIDAIADETALLAARLDHLLTRMTGPRTATGGDQADQPGGPLTASYASSLGRLQDNVSRACGIMDEIETIA